MKNLNTSKEKSLFSLKFDLKMKFTTFLLIVTLFNVQAKNYAQNTKISLNLEKVRIEKVLMEIESLTDYKFFFSREDIDVNKIISIKVKNEKVKTILEDIFRDMPVSVEVLDKQIIIKEKISTQETSIPVKNKELQQKIKITGKITDSKGEPLPGANVVEKGTNNTVTTDFDGKFSIEVNNQNSILVATYIGFTTQEISLNGRTNLTIKLLESAASLNEVVVQVGYGSVKKGNLTGAVGVITAKQIEDKIGPNTGQLLQGIAPNLNVSLSDGDINGEANINVRGIASINGGSALILIDGVQGNINRISPKDIESISILKDAASAAIYGARAAFGVVLVTTKKGKEGKIKINYNSNFNWSTPTINTNNFITDGLDWSRLSDKLSLIENKSTYLGYSAEDYAYLEARRNDPTLPSVLIKTVDGVERYVHYGNTDWWNTIFSDSQASSEHNLNLSGGTDKVNVYLSGRFYTREGIYKINKDVLDSYSMRAKIDAKPYKWLSIANSTSIFNKSYTSPATNTRNVSDASNSEDWRKYTFHASPLYLPTNPDGSLIIKGAYTNNRDIADGTFADLIYGKSRAEEKDFEVLNTTPVTVNLMKGLKVNGDYSFRKRQQSEWVRLISAPYTNQPNGEGVQLYKTNTQIYKELERNELYQAINAYADYEFNPIENHTFSALVGYNQEWNSFKRNIASRNGNLSDNLNSFNLATGENIYLNSTEEEWAIRASFYRVKYNYLNKYLIEFNGRFDLSSRFPTDKRLGYFPSTSAAWKVSSESFWENIKPYVGNLKFRASYGSLGNQNVGAYDYISKMSINQGSYISGGNLTNYFTTPNPISSNFTWEKSVTVDFGVDMSAFNNRFSVSYDWYQRDVSDMLTTGTKLPSVFGATEPKENAANLSTKGFELSVTWKDDFELAGKPFGYNFNFTLGDSRTFITKFDNPNGDIQQYYVGQEVGEVWGYTVDGFFQTDDEYMNHADQALVNERIQNNYLINHPVAGDIKFADLNGDGVISPGDKTLANHGDLKKIGNTNPRYNYGVTVGGNYAGFDLNVFAQGIMHRDWNPGTDNSFFWGPFTRQYDNFYPKSIEANSWTPENPNAYFPRLGPYMERGGPYEGEQLGVNSDKYLQNAAYLRIKNITLGYSLPQTVVSKLHLDALRFYTSGVNLFTFSPLYKHNPDRTVDPEQLGDGNAYPFSKTYAFGLDIKF